jgi:RNA 3'-terminal phosphate cyclase (ATP)
MIYIDGSAKSGSGTIVRCAIALSSLVGEALHIDNIRAKRDKPGLRPQHLASVSACAQMCGAEVEGAKVNSLEIIYKPGKPIRGGDYRWDIGTAGSTTLLAATLLPVALFADGETTLTLSGGLFQDFAPSAHHMQRVLLPTLARMGAAAELQVVRPGYYPRGGGTIQVRVQPVRGGIKPLRLLTQGEITRVSGLALSSHLRQQRVSQRMAEECQRVVASGGYRVAIDTLWDETAPQAGASLAVWAETDSGCLLGADRAGKRGRSSEEIGTYVARSLFDDLETGATVDRHLGDQLIIYGALASGVTEYIVPRFTEHIDANLWLAAKFGAKPRLDGTRLRIEGMGHTRQAIAPPHLQPNA